jgi:hypothetical protein
MLCIRFGAGNAFSIDGHRSLTVEAADRMVRPTILKIAVKSSPNTDA